MQRQRFWFFDFFKLTYVTKLNYGWSKKAVIWFYMHFTVLAAQKDKFVEAIINLIGSADYILDTWMYSSSEQSE